MRTVARAPIVALLLALIVAAGLAALTGIAAGATSEVTTSVTDTVTMTDTASSTPTDTATPTDTTTPTDTATPTASATPTDTATASATATATASVTATTTATDAPITTWWAVRQRTVANGRTYYVARPFCAPLVAPACTAFLEEPRRMVIYSHPANWAEDATTAANALAYFHNIDPGTIYAFAVSAGGTQVFDAGICCTTAPVDEISYLAGAVDDTARMVGVDRQRVGLLGISNGGMLAERGTCERPNLFAAAASLSGSFAGQCTTGVTTVRQWHGSADTVVPLNGGPVYVAGAYRTVLPAESLAQRMASGSHFELDVLPGLGHGLPSSVLREAALWLSSTLATR